MLFYYLIYIYLIGSVCHELKDRKTWLVAHANENASDIHSFSNECHSIPIPKGLKYPLSPGAGKSRKVTLDEWHEISLEFMDCNYQIKSKRHLNQIIHFPPAYLHKGGLQSKCESISSMFVKCLESDGYRCGLVALGYDVKKHVEFLDYCAESDHDKVHLNLPEDQENHILLYHSSINLIMNVRVTEGTDLEAIHIAQSECNEELKAIALIYDSFLKENEMILCGVVAAPNIDLQQQEISTFLCKTCVSINLILSKLELSSTDHLQSWWRHFVKRINKEIVKTDDLFKENKLKSKDLFYSVASQILAVMSAVSTHLPSLHGNSYQKICTILLNMKQLLAINDVNKKKMIRGAYGSGKSIVGKEIVRLICLTNKPRTLVYYICLDKYCFMDYHMRNDVTNDLMLTSQSNVDIIVTNILDLIEEYGFYQVSSISLLLISLCRKKRDDYDEIHFVIDEVDGECITSQEASDLQYIFHKNDNLRDSIVVLLIQPMEKHRIFAGSNPKSHDSNCFDIEGMKKFQLDRSMRNTMQINEVLKVAQFEISKEPNEYDHGAAQIKQGRKGVKLTQVTEDIGFFSQDIGSVNQDEEKQNEDEIKIVNLTEDSDTMTEKMEEPNEYNHGTVQIKQGKKRVKPTQVTEDIGFLSQDIGSVDHGSHSVNPDEEKRNQDLIKIYVDDVDILAEKMDAARRGKSSVTTVTDFIYNGKCFVGHSIAGPKPLVVFLNEPYTEDSLPFVNKVLAVFLKDVIESEVISPRVVICNDIQVLKLLERIFSLLKNVNSVTYAPWMLQKLATKKERDQVNRKMTDGYVLLTDNKGFRGMEEEEVLILLGKNEYYHRHYLPESICRAAAKLTLIVVEKTNDKAIDTLPNLRELLDKKLDKLVKKKLLCTEEDPDNVNAIREEGATYYVNISSEDFLELDVNIEHIVVPTVEDAEKQYVR